MDVAVAADTDSEHVVSHSRTALGVGNEVVEVEPDLHDDSPLKLVRTQT